MGANSKSIQDMSDRSSKYIWNQFDSYEMRKLLIEATFEKVKADGFKLLEIGGDGEPIVFLLREWTEAAENGMRYEMSHFSCARRPAGIRKFRITGGTKWLDN